MDLLDKGLSFIPSFRSIPLSKIYEAQNRLIRNLKLKDYFSDRPDAANYMEARKFTCPSKWSPPDHKISQSTLDTIQDIVTRTESIVGEHKISNNQCLLLHNYKSNLTNLEQTALRNLRNNDEIVIKPADKGGATVIMNKSSYINEAYRQLNNSNYYTKLTGPVYKNNISKINDILSSMVNDGLISKKQLEFLRASDSDRARVFYLLPKIHKPRDKWPNPDMPEGRPIVSDCGSESYRISSFIDSHTRPISKHHPSYLKDTYDFVGKIKGFTIPSHALLITGDVSSLYTNMNLDRTLSVTKLALDKHRPLDVLLNNYLCKLLEVTLRNNDFTFNGDYYLQICGTAMGKSYAPGLADLYLEEFDYKACNEFKITPLLYFRFLDDVFSIMIATTTEVKEFENYLNSLIPGIKITLEYSSVSVNFLDTTVYKSLHSNDGSCALYTKVFFKETDTHQLLHKSSFHPKHTFRGVLKSQLLRFKRISSTFADYENTCKILFKSLQKRNYSKSLLRKMKRDIYLAADGDRGNTRPSVHDPLLPIVVPYCNAGSKFVRCWRNTISTNTNFSKYRFVNAYCNGKSLYNKLVSSSLVKGNARNNNDGVDRQVVASEHGCRWCTSNRCRACRYIIEATTFKSSHNRRTFQIASAMNCKSSNIIYVITCKQCGKQYVGETGRTLADRINDHLSRIRTKKDTPIGLHFNQSRHCIDDFSILPIEKIADCQNSYNLRIEKEKTWQNLLQTAFPLGINNVKKRFQAY